MAAGGKLFIGGEVPKSLISLVLGILAITVCILALGSLITHPIDLSSGFTADVQLRLSLVIIGMTLGFGLGMAAWIAACDAFPGDKSQPHWKMCRVGSGIGIGFGVLAVLGYLAFISLLPALLPVLK